MDNYKPTCNLRFVERTEFVNYDANGHYLPHDVVREIKRNVLQQRWHSDYVGEEPQWRDVSLVAEEGPNE